MSKDMHAACSIGLTLLSFTTIFFGRVEAAQCVPWKADLAGRKDLLVGDLSVDAQDVFDTDRVNQGRLVHRTVNALHMRTHAATVIQAMPFREGEPFVLAMLGEAERELRSKSYLRRARVVPVRLCGNAVDIDVRTVDNWTLTPSLSCGRAGGPSRSSIELQDRNVLGLGKEVSFRLKRSDNRRETAFSYGDDNVLGGRHRLRIEVGKTNDGRLLSLGTGLPFFSTGSSNSWWLSAESHKESSTPGG